MLGPRRIPSTISPTIVGCRNRLIVKWLSVARVSRMVSCWKSASVPAIAGLKRDARIKSLTARGQSRRRLARVSTDRIGIARLPQLWPRSLGPFRAVPADFVLGHDDAEVEDVVRVGVVSDAPPFRQNLVELDFHGPAPTRRTPRDYETRRRGSPVRYMITILACVPAPALDREQKKGGWGESGWGRISLLHQVEAVPVAAEVLDLARRQLEAGAQLAVLEEDVRVPQAGGVEVLPLALLGEDALDALDESDLFEDADLAVAGRDRDAIALADFLGADFPLVRGEKDLGAVFVGQKLGRLERREQLRGPLKSVIFRAGVSLHGTDPAQFCAVDDFAGYLSYRA